MPQARREQPRQSGIAEHHPAAGRYSIGLVAELLWGQLVKIMENLGLEELRVQCRDSIDGMTAKGSQVRHADVPFAGFIDQRETAHAIFVAGITPANFVEMATVDLIDDFKMARQQTTKEADGPPLERFRQ